MGRSPIVLAGPRAAMPARKTWSLQMNRGERIAPEDSSGALAAPDRPSWREMLRQLAFPDAGFAQKKYEDHRRFTAAVLGILAVFLPLLWCWDYVTDPVGAQNTVGLRLLFVLVLPLAIGFWSGQARRRFLEVAMPVTLLAGEVVFVEILNRLDSGMVYGLAGFMYCMYISLLTGQGLSLARGVAYMLAAAALPQLMAAFALAPGFSQAHYGILMWPAAGLAVLAQAAFAVEYLKRYRLEEQLKHLSDTDALSNVGNRRYFMRRLRQETTRAQRLKQPLSLLVLDIDHFKRVNDTFGHLSGDEVIRQLAALCRNGVRGIDVVARIGGEEFAILLIATPQERALRIAERIRASVASAEVQGTAEVALRFAVSIGVAQMRSDDSDELVFFGRADAALYAAKEGGRNRVMPG